MRFFVFYVPNLRFSNTAYNKIILKEICSIYGGYAFDSKKMSSVKSKYQIIKMGNLYNGILDLDRNPSYIEKITANEKEYLIKQGDILITLTGTQNKQDYGYTVYINEDMNSLLNQRCAFIKSHNINAKYLYYLLNTNRFKIQFFSSATGGTGNQANVSTKDIEIFSMYVPLHSEQIEISNFLTKIDERICAQSKIIEEIKVLKNSIANQLIFNNKQLNINLSLGNFAKLKNGYAFKSDTYSEDGKFNIITIANVQGDKNINTISCNKILKIPNDIQQHQILRINDVLISLTGNVGRVSIVDTPNCLLNQRVGVLKFVDETYKSYIFQVISNKKFENQMILKGQGAAQKNIGNNDVESFIIPFIENNKYINQITNLLESFDKKIAIEEKILNDYICQKKYLLSNMFI